MRQRYIRLARHLIANVLVFISTTSVANQVAPTWTASWGAAMLVPADKYALQADADVTLRQVMRLSAGGSAVRIRLSNVHGDAPLVIGAATFAPARAGSSQLDAAALRPLRFGGAPGITIAPGAEAVTDPLDIGVVAGQDVAVTLHAVSVPARQSALQAAHSTQYAAPGNQAASASLDGARTSTSWYFVTGIEVQGAARPVLVAIGDSLTNGSGSRQNENERWTDWLARRVAAEGQAPLAIVNAGIGGNMMLGGGTGPALLERFGRDVLQRPGVTHAVVLIGVNDLGRLRRSGKESAASRQALLDGLQAGWRELAASAHARGVCLVAGTLTPYGGSTLFKPAPHNEADRQALNDWLRKSDLFDGVADFDAAVRDPAAPERLLPDFDSGDRLHLSPAGYRAMAQAVPLDRLAACQRRAVAITPFSPVPTGTSTR